MAANTNIASVPASSPSPNAQSIAELIKISWCPYLRVGVQLDRLLQLVNDGNKKLMQTRIWNRHYYDIKEIVVRHKLGPSDSDVRLYNAIQLATKEIMVLDNEHFTKLCNCFSHALPDDLRLNVTDLLEFKKSIQNKIKTRVEEKQQFDILVNEFFTRNKFNCDDDSADDTNTERYKLMMDQYRRSQPALKQVSSIQRVLAALKQLQRITKEHENTESTHTALCIIKQALDHEQEIRKTHSTAADNNSQPRNGHKKRKTDQTDPENQSDMMMVDWKK